MTQSAMTTPKVVHVLRVIAATAIVVLATLVPFLPGPYDSLAAPISLMAQFGGKVGLLLVPIGALWIASAYWNRLAAKQHGIAIAALIMSTLVWISVALAALVSSGPLLGLGVLVLWIYVVAKIWRRLRLWKSAPPRPTSAVAFYLLIVPVAVVLSQAAITGPAVEFSRNRAIRNSAQLIADIEHYRAANGRYPESLLSEWEDYKPGVIGIKGYHYEPKGDAYNVFFEQPSDRLGTREFVMYNPRDEQAFTSHKMDRLQLTPAELALEQTRGHYAVHDAPHPHWKYFWFD